MGNIHTSSRNTMVEDTNYEEQQLSDFYCRKCGSRMLVYKILASEVRECSWGDCYYPHSDYDQKTGKQVFGLKFYCPNKNWWNSHDSWTELLEEKK